MSARRRASRARSRAPLSEARTTEERRPMIAMTTKSSMSVKPACESRLVLNIVVMLLDGRNTATPLCTLQYVHICLCGIRTFRKRIPDHQPVGARAHQFFDRGFVHPAVDGDHHVGIECVYFFNVR